LELVDATNGLRGTNVQTVMQLNNEAK